MPKKKYKEKFIKIKEQEQKVNVDKNEEMNLQDDEYDNNIILDWVD